VRIVPTCTVNVDTACPSTTTLIVVLCPDLLGLGINVVPEVDTIDESAEVNEYVRLA
jgi:hypothetical protein